MARKPQYLRGGGIRSSAPYGYARRRLAPNEQEKSNVFAWTVAILILTALAIVSWIVPAYVFRNPQVPINYKLLRALGKLEDVRRFAPNDPPQVVGFYTAASLFERESGRSAEAFQVISALQKKLYIENYKEGEMLGYVTGDFEIIAIREMSRKDFFRGLALRARSLDFPKVILEYLIPAVEIVPGAYEIGETLSIKRSGHLAAILHLEHLPRDTLSVSVVSLTYSDKGLDDGRKQSSAPPAQLNLLAEWPVFAEPLSK